MVHGLWARRFRLCIYYYLKLLNTANYKILVIQRHRLVIYLYVLAKAPRFFHGVALVAFVIREAYFSTTLMTCYAVILLCDFLKFFLGLGSWEFLVSVDYWGFKCLNEDLA